MNKTLVLTIVGADRPGLVEAVSEVVVRHGGNWLESRMAQLAGRFAGILQVSVPAESVDAVTGALSALEASGLLVHVVQGDAVQVGEGGRKLTIELTGADRPGIVRDIAHAIASNGANVEKLSTEAQPMPMTGESLFVAEVEVSVDQDTDLEGLRAALESVAGHLMVEIQIEESDA